MSDNITIRIDEEMARSLREIKKSTGTGAGQLVRAGLQKTISQFKRDGFLKIEPATKGEK